MEMAKKVIAKNNFAVKNGEKLRLGGFNEGHKFYSETKAQKLAAQIEEAGKMIDANFTLTTDIGQLKNQMLPRTKFK